MVGVRKLNKVKTTRKESKVAAAALNKKVELGSFFPIINNFFFCVIFWLIAFELIGKVFLQLIFFIN